MIKQFVAFFTAALVALQGCAQFVPGQVLGAAALNAALASPTITSGSINGAPIGQSNPKAVNATSIGLVGSGSGTISILPQSAAGTYNFNLPTSAGDSGSVLTASGSSSSPMTWTPQSSLRAGVASAAATTATTSSASFYPALFGTSSAGDQSFYTASNFSFNPGTGIFQAPELLASSTKLPDNYASLRVARNITLTGASGYNTIGVNAQVGMGATAYSYAFGSVRGYQAQVSSNNTGDVGSLMGSYYDVSAGSPGGNITSLYGSYHLLSNYSSTSTVTNLYGNYILFANNYGTVTNSYGVYVGAMTGSTGTYTNQPYSFYASDDNARNSFAGKTYFTNASTSTSTTTGAVQVTGGVAIGKSLYVGNAVGISQTITAAGTTGARTINAAAGTVNFAAAASSLVVTNSYVTTSSTVHCSVRTADATAYIKNCVPASGSFTINLGAAATAETSVGFLVIN